MSSGETFHQTLALFPLAPLACPLSGAGCRQGRKPRRAAPIPSHTFTGRKEDGVWTCGRGRPGGVLWTLDGGVPAPGYPGSGGARGK